MKIDLSKIDGGKPCVSLEKKTVLAYCLAMKLGEAITIDELSRETGVCYSQVSAVVRRNNLRFYMTGDDGKPLAYAASPETIAKYTKP